MHSRTAQRISILGWLGVLLDALLLIQIVWPGTSQQWALRLLTPLVPYRRAIDAVALALLVVGGLLEGAGHLRGIFPRLSTPPVEEGELRWSQPHTGLRASDWFGRAFMVYGGALPALFVAGAVLLFLSAPARQFLFFVAIISRFPARRLGYWLALRWLNRTRPYTVSLSARGMAAPLPFVPWEGFSCYEAGAAPDRFVVFGRPFPTPPLTELEPPQELVGRVHAVLRERLGEATAGERAAWRAKQATWVARLSVPLLVTSAAVPAALLLHDRNLACIGLGLAFFLCDRWLVGLAGRILGLAPARPPAATVAEPSPEVPAAPPSRALKAVSRLGRVAFAVGLVGWLYANWRPEWEFSRSVGWASLALLVASFVLGDAERRLRERAGARRAGLPPSR